MKHFTIFSIVLSIIIILGAQVVSAQEASVVSADSQETVSAKDLEVSEPTLLPSSSFYFFKNWSRGIRKAFTFNPMKKLELELRFADEKAMEAKKMAESDFKETQSIERALENYRASQLELKARLQNLKETSSNPRVDKLLEKFADRAVRHEKLFDGLKKKFEDKDALKIKIESMSKTIEENLAEAAKKDEAEKFVKKIEKALDKVKGDNLKHINSLEFIDRLDDKMDDKVKDNLVRVRHKFSERLKEDVEEFAEEHKDKTAERVKEALEKLPGDKARQLIILEEIEREVQKPVRNALKEAKEGLEEEIEKNESFNEKVQEAIERAKKQISELEQKMNLFTTVPQKIVSLLKEARDKIGRAQKMFDEEKFGEAFGQARSAEVAVRNGLRFFEGKEKEIIDKDERIYKENLQKYLAELKAKLDNLEDVIAIVKQIETKDEARNFLSDARHHLQEANEALQHNKIDEADDHRIDTESLIERIKFLTDLLIEKKPERTYVCTQEYNPVCGVDGKTYSNQCAAEKIANVKIQYKGECKNEGRNERKIEIENKREEKKNNDNNVRQ